MKIFKTITFFLVSLIVVSSLLMITIFHYSLRFNENLFNMASNNLESTYDAVSQIFSRQIEEKNNDLKMINVYLNDESDESTIKKYLKSVITKSDIDDFYFVNENDFYNIDGKVVFNEASFSSYGMDDNFRFDGQSFYFILNVEEKSYQNINYNKIAITYDEDNFLSNVSIKAYKQECNSGIFLNDGRLLSNLENDFWNYDNIFELLEEFEFKDKDILFANELNTLKHGTYELKYKNTDYYLHFEKTIIDGVILIGLIPRQAMHLTVSKIQTDTIIMLSGFGGIILSIIFLTGFIYYKKKITMKNKELKIQNVLFQTLSENMDDIFVLLDKKLKPMYVSPNSLRLIGVSPNEIKDDINKMFECDASNVEPLIHDAKNLEIGQSTEVERRLRNKITGETYWCLDKLYHLREKNEDIYICILADRTKEKKNYEQIETALDVAKQANHAKTSFLANMSHDLRTPMNAILGFSNLLLESNDDTKAKEYASKINSSSKILMDIINDILDLSKIEAGKQTLNISSNQIDDVLKKVEMVIKPLANKKNITFNIYKKNIKHNNIETDSLKLVQVFTNVISNSIKYTHDGGLVTFLIKELSSESTRVGKFEFIVEDNGIGMSKDFLNDIFLPFAREKDKVKNIQGTGLGMPIAKNIIDLLGGTINVESEENKGTKFTIRFDFGIVNDPVKVITQDTIINNDIDLSGKRVLVVEDNEINIILIKEILEKNKIIVDVACNGEEGFNKVMMNHNYDCILMDVVMPVMNGYEATRKIRNVNYVYNKSVPIIAMTANAFLTDVEDAIKSGMNEHISKPIDFIKLLVLLKKVIK